MLKTYFNLRNVVATAICLSAMALSSKTVAQNSGNIGDSIHWEYTPADSSLSVTCTDNDGSVRMPNFDSRTSMPWNHLRDSLKHLTVGEGITTIGYYDFADFMNLTDVSFPESLLAFGPFAFDGCKSLTSVTIPDSVTGLSSGAFRYCEGLTSVTIGKKMSTPPSDAFLRCRSLISFNVSPDNPYLSTEDGVLFNKDKTQLRVYPIAKPETTYTIPESVTTLQTYAFAYSNLTSITIPKSVIIINDNVFYSADKLISTDVAQDNSYFSSEDGVLFTKNKKTLWLYPAGKTETSYIISDSVIETKIYAFYGNDSLRSVTIPNSVTTIGAYNFAYCMGLTSIAIPNSITSIPSGICYYNDSVNTVIIGDSVTAIESYAFYYNRAMTKFISYTATPPTVASGGLGFATPTGKTTIYVPAASVDAYKAASGWSSRTIKAIVSVESVTFNEVSLSLKVDSVATLVATVTPDTATNQIVTFSSSNPAVATVDAAGVVTAVSEGTAVITASTYEGGFTDECEVTVTQPVMGVSLNKSELSLHVDSTETLVATVLPDEATNQTVTFSSSDTTVATVNETTGLVTAVAAGTAMIIVTTEDGDFTDTCKVTVASNSSIAEHLQENALRIYPNPVENELRIDNVELAIDNVMIYDVYGRMVKEARATNGTTTINVSHLSAGIYVVKIGTQTAKFVKK
ncbi:MAG: leucine-rich repeat protein [Bacteroidales bacterium]|jgi:uncharacterized protein YjdB|nr:leucine-rich repeat protein [Bacteroidales bacterium]